LTGALPDGVRHEIVRSDKALQSARALLKDQLNEDSVSRAYYAVLHAARAALLARGIASDSHQSTRGMFGLHLVKPDLVSKELARIFTAAQEDRELGDYDVDVIIEPARAAERLRQAEQFVAEIKRFPGMT